MAIVRTAGTEIIRSVAHQWVNNTSANLIIGVQHHIYTVLSITVQCQALQTAGNYIEIKLTGYDSYLGETAQDINIIKQVMTPGETFIFNDKFSFNGYEPTDFTGAMNGSDDQDAIADQGSSVSQVLKLNGTEGNDKFDVICTYIDQNNS